MFLPKIFETQKQNILPFGTSNFSKKEKKKKNSLQSKETFPNKQMLLEYCKLFDKQFENKNLKSKNAMKT